MNVVFSNTGYGNTVSGPTSIEVSDSDALTVIGVAVSKAWVSSHDDNPLMIEADYFHTAHLFIDSSTPSFTLTAYRGHDYRTPATGTKDQTALNPGTLMLLLGDKKVDEK